MLLQYRADASFALLRSVLSPMSTPPTIPVSVAQAIFEDLSVAFAIFDRRSKLQLWTNAAWQELDARLDVGNDERSEADQSFLHKLDAFFDRARQARGYSSLRVETVCGESVELRVILFPYSQDKQELVAVWVRGATPAVSREATSSRLPHADPLTGLPARAVLIEQLEAYLNSPTKPPFALLFIDLDGFKGINDMWGHVAGDKVLAEMAARLAAAVRQQDLLARYGGDEFLVLVEGIYCTQELAPVVDRLRQAAEKPIELEGQRLRISASIGAALSSEGWNSVSELVHSADQRMYADKRKSDNIDT